MLPGKKYTPDDILLILRRRYWLLLLPLAVVSALTAIAARVLPDLYPFRNVDSGRAPARAGELHQVNGHGEDRRPAAIDLAADPQSHRLERVIQDFNLYAAQRRNGIMEDIVENMRSDISVQVVKGDAFRVSYVGRDPRTVMKVTERLAGLFIEENLRDREVLAEGTNQFLEAQLEDARRRLIEQEKKLEVYRRSHGGELPE